MKKWFALFSDGKVRFVGVFDDWGDADDAAEKVATKKRVPANIGSAVVWTFDEATARQWRRAINRKVTP